MALLFFTSGCVIGNWLTRIPAVAANLHVGTTVLGGTFFASGLGAICAMAPVSRLIEVRGSKSPARFAAVAACLLFIAVAYASTIQELAIALFTCGAAVGTLDVSMNTQALAVEREYGRSVMSGFHAFWSLGAMAGGGFGAFCAWLAVGVQEDFIILGACLAVVVAAGSRWLLDGVAPRDRAVTGSPTSAQRKYRWATVLLLGLVGLAMSVTEGSMDNWNALFLHDIDHVSLRQAGFGYVVFSLAMTIGRLVGDKAVGWLGQRNVVRWGALLAAGGFIAAVAFPSLSIALPSFLLCGLGLAALVPLVFSAVGHVTENKSGPVGFITALNYGGLLLGPPVVGAVCQLTNLRAALVIPIALCMFVCAVAQRIFAGRTSRVRDRRRGRVPAATSRGVEDDTAE